MPNGQPSPLPHNPRAAGFIPHRTHRPTTFSPARGTIQQHICSEFSPYRHAQPHHRGTPSIPPQGYFWLQPGLRRVLTTQASTAPGIPSVAGPGPLLYHLR